MALGFSATLLARKRLGIFPRSLEIERVLHDLESIRNEDSGISDLAVQKRSCSALQPTFTGAYLSEEGFLIVVANYLGHFTRLKSGHFTCPLTFASHATLLSFGSRET